LRILSADVLNPSGFYLECLPGVNTPAKDLEMMDLVVENTEADTCDEVPSVILMGRAGVRRYICPPTKRAEVYDAQNEA
jgi:hypothetical protein